MPLTFVVLACNLLVSGPNENTPSCQEFKEELYDETGALNPFTCMMSSMHLISRFHQTHPGWQIRRWSCKYLKPELDI